MCISYMENIRPKRHSFAKHRGPMRRPPPNFKVERRTARRPTRQQQYMDSDVALLDEPSMDDVPARDIRDDFDGSEEERSSRAREQAEKLFSPRERELPVDSTDIFPPKPEMRTVAPEPQEAADTPAEPQRRILQNVTWVDPVQQRLQEEQERRATRRLGRPPKIRPEGAPKLGRPRKVRPEGEAVVRSAKTRALDIIDLPPPPVARPTTVRVAPQTIRAVRRRHPEPRILYNKWGYSQILRDAQHMPREVAEIVLKPGQTWRRRMPVATWR